MMTQPMLKTRCLIAACCPLLAIAAEPADGWRIDSDAEWSAAAAQSDGLAFKDGMAAPTGETALFRSVVRRFDDTRRLGKITLTQSPEWRNWEPAGKAGPTNLEDAPVFLVKAPGDYWLFGLYRNGKGQVGKTGIQDQGNDFQAQPAKLDGSFHVIYEDWTPIDASKHSWDSPLAGHALSADGIRDFKILGHAVDQRTKPTGRKGTYAHPHWKQHPDWKSNVAEYEIHEPEQNAFGDWAAISIGGQYYLFCDYHPANDKIRIGWFTSGDIGKPFTFCGELGQGHPDPDIGFAEGKFYLINQTSTDYTSPGPWVESVEIRAGVDTTGDGAIDTWTDWQAVKETYQHIPGFSKQIQRVPADMDLSKLPATHGFAFELRIRDTTANPSIPILDAVHVSFQ